MSHVAALEDLLVTDLDALDHACKELGLVLVRDQKTYKWYGTWMNDWNDERAAAQQGYDPGLFGKCDHAIRREGHRDGDYEIGLVKRPDGQPGYAVVYDNYGSGRYFATKLGGVDLPELKVEYGVASAIKFWQRKGFQTSRSTNAAGEVKVEAFRRS